MLLELWRCATTCCADFMLPALDPSRNQETAMLLCCDALIVDT
jgi:hypothetical protein